MSLDQHLNICRPTVKLLVILVGSLVKGVLMNTAHQPARLGVGCRSVKNMVLVTANTHTNSKQERKTEREYFGPSVHSARSGLTTQAQRPGTRDEWIANHDAMPGSLQRMVRRCGHLVTW